MNKDLSVRSKWLSASSPSNTQLEVAHSNVSSRFNGFWSLSKLLLPMNYRDFASITKKFHHSVSEAFGTDCDIAITSHTQAPKSTTLQMPDLDSRIEEMNQETLLIEIPSLFAHLARGLPSKERGSIVSHDDRSLTVADELNMEKLWNDAGYVRVSMNPFNADAAPKYAMAVIHFKGIAPRHASFYIQPSDENSPCGQQVASQMRTWGKGFTYHEGRKEHTINLSGDIFDFANFKFGFGR